MRVRLVFHCPNCRSQSIRPSWKPAIRDSFLRIIGVRPHRCHTCRSRFYLFLPNSLRTFVSALKFQVTNGSPANPQGLDHAGQYIQWTAGAGYTIRQGFRIGMSGFRGPYLDRSLAPLLPAGTTLRDFPASAVGVDIQWARGRWSANGEWQRFHFDSPNFVVSPSMASTYGEVKTVINPRLFLAARAGWLSPGGVVDKKGISTGKFAPSVASYELAAGWWLNRRQLLKTSYEWFNIEHRPGTRTNVLGVELVTTFHTLDWPFR
jgi:hypothetical protein